MDKAKLIILLLFISVIASGYPRSGTYETLPKKAREISENDVENPRTDSRAQRRASENKRPWDKDQSFLDMEGFIAPPYDYRPPNIPNPDIVQDDANDKQDKANLGCAFYSPNIVSGNLCDDNSYKLRMGLLTGVVTDWSQSGPGSASYDGNMAFNVTWSQNLEQGSEIGVNVEATSLDDGSKSYCNGTVKFLCCFNFDILPSDQTIGPGGSVSEHADSINGSSTFEWSISGLGYTLDKMSTRDGYSVSISCADGNVGYDFSPAVTVTATNNCDQTKQITIWNTDASCATIAEYIYTVYLETIETDPPEPPGQEVIPTTFTIINCYETLAEADTARDDQCSSEGGCVVSECNTYPGLGGMFDGAVVGYCRGKINVGDYPDQYRTNWVYIYPK